MAHSYQARGVSAQMEMQMPQSAGRRVVRVAMRLVLRDWDGTAQKERSGPVVRGLVFQNGVKEREGLMGMG